MGARNQALSTSLSKIFSVALNEHHDITSFKFEASRSAHVGIWVLSLSGSGSFDNDLFQHDHECFGKKDNFIFCFCFWEHLLQWSVINDFIIWSSSLPAVQRPAEKDLLGYSGLPPLTNLLCRHRCCFVIFIDQPLRLRKIERPLNLLRFVGVSVDEWWRRQTAQQDMRYDMSEAASPSKICPNNSKEDDDNGKVYLVGLPQKRIYISRMNG